MGKLRHWWDDLKLDPATARLVAGRDPGSPEELAGVVRVVPSEFRNHFGPDARADLARAVTAHLAAGTNDDAGYRDLLEALQEAVGERAPKPVPKVEAKFGLVPNPNPAPPPPPVRHLPKLGATGPGRLPPPKPSPKPADGDR